MRPVAIHPRAIGLATETIYGAAGTARPQAIQRELKDAVASLKPVPVVCAALLWKNRLAGLAKPRTVSLETRDVATLVNFLSSQRSALSTGAAAWTPVCLQPCWDRARPTPFARPPARASATTPCWRSWARRRTPSSGSRASRARLEASALEAGACRAVWKLTNAEIFVASMAWGT